MREVKERDESDPYDESYNSEDAEEYFGEYDNLIQEDNESKNSSNPILKYRCPGCKKQVADESYKSLRDVNNAQYAGSITCPYCGYKLPKIEKPKYEAHPNFIPFG